MLKGVVECDEIKTFENGKVALDHLTEETKKNIEPPEVIFLDINMPIMDGWEFLEGLMQLNLKEKIIINVVTSSIDPSDYEKWNTFRINCLHYLNFKNKPIFRIDAADLKRINLAS